MFPVGKAASKSRFEIEDSLDYLPTPVSQLNSASAGGSAPAHVRRSRTDYDYLYIVGDQPASIPDHLTSMMRSRRLVRPSPYGVSNSFVHALSKFQLGHNVARYSRPHRHFAGMCASAPAKAAVNIKARTRNRGVAQPTGMLPRPARSATRRRESLSVGCNHDNRVECFLPRSRELRD